MSMLTHAGIPAAAQQPDWHRSARLREVVAELATRPPLVDAVSCLALRDELRLVARGEAFVLQAGECAERFTECTPAHVGAKAGQLHFLADIWETFVGRAVVRIGRFAGQFAKPRSSPTERLTDGTVLPSYRGDAVNDPAPTQAARRPAPDRLLRAYDCSAAALGTLAISRLLLTPGAFGLSARLAPTYISHEALLLDYEMALVRNTERAGSRYASSAHLLWVGERTRQVAGAHLAFVSALANPIGLKIGPTAPPAEVRQIVLRLCAGRPPGRLLLICRLGAHAVNDRMAGLLAALGDLSNQVVWVCDPMHGNTIRMRCGQKTRVVADLLDEVEGFCTVLRANGLHPGGLHLEITPNAVTECVDTHADLAARSPLPRYESACDPRLNPEQAERVVRRTCELLAAQPRGGEGGTLWAPRSTIALVTATSDLGRVRRAPAT